MDTLTLKSLQFRGKHGHYEKERRKGNDFEVDLVITSDLRRAGDSDKLSDTIDYQEALEIVQSVMLGPPVKLLETLAKRIGDRLFQKFTTIKHLQVAIRKLHPPVNVETAYSEIRMSWQR